MLLILKSWSILWNSTLVSLEDKLSSATVDFIRSEGKLKTKRLVFSFPSDLMKSTVADESLSSNETNVLFQRILQDFQD